MALTHRWQWSGSVGEERLVSGGRARLRVFIQPGNEHFIWSLIWELLNAHLERMPMARRLPSLRPCDTARSGVSNRNHGGFTSSHRASQQLTRGLSQPEKSFDCYSNGWGVMLPFTHTHTCKTHTHTHTYRHISAQAHATTLCKAHWKAGNINYIHLYNNNFDYSMKQCSQLTPICRLN